MLELFQSFKKENQIDLERTHKGRIMLMKHYSRLGLLLGILFFVTGIQPLWADTTGYFEIQNGSGGGFRYSGIHKIGESSFTYSLLSGRLNVDLNTVGLISLTNITGTLTASQGTIEITGGELSEQSNGFASGFLDYTLTGALTESGTFNFLDKQECCSNAINDGPNHLTLNGFTLWGGNIPNQSQTALGIDLVGGNYTTTPEPSTMLLLGTGLLALPFMRKKKR